MRKINIHEEEITLVPFQLDEKAERMVIADIRTVIKNAINNVDDLAEMAKNLSGGMWSCDIGSLTSLFGGWDEISPLLYKPARKDEAWLRRVPLKELISLLVNAYFANQELYNEMFEDGYGMERVKEDPLDIRIIWVYLKLEEYGYCQLDIQNMNFNEIAALYKDLIETDQKKREKFIKTIKEIMAMPYVRALV